MNPSPAHTASATVASDAEDIRDIRGLVEIPSGWLWLGYLAVLLVAIVAALALARWLRRPPAGPAAPSADAVALAALERARAWMTPTQAEKFGTAVSSAVREYIEARFDVSAPRRTTEEFLRDLTREPAADLASHVSKLEELLRRMDLVKFAREPLDEPQMEGLLDSARNFVTRTRRSDEEPTS